MDGCSLPRREVTLAVALLALAGLVLTCTVCPVGRAYWNYHFRIRTGMTLAEVECVLGPGMVEEPPGLRTPDGRIRAAVQGDQVRVYPGWAPIWIGFRDGKVCDTWLEETWP
jgi:hypothetical protein